MNPDPDTCIHLTPEQILEIHSAAIRLFGGSPGLRDSALLQSAAAAPRATFGGKSTVGDTVEIAAAYLCYGRTLGSDDGLRAGYFSYNHSEFYVETVLSFAHGYARYRIPNPLPPPPVPPTIPGT